MKKYVFILLPALSCSLLFGELPPEYDEAVVQVLAPNAECINIESVLHRPGYKIKAHAVDILFNCHIARYMNAFVTTTLEDQVEQSINFEDEDDIDNSEGKVELCSTEWKIEEIKGVKFVVFQYDGFKIYSNDKEQYILSDRQ